VQDELPAIDDLCPEDTKDRRDLYNNTFHLLTTLADGLPKHRLSKDLEEKSDSLVTSCSGMNDEPHSPHTMVTTAAALSQQSEVCIDGEVIARTRAASITSTLNNAVGPQVAEVDSKQEWEVRDIIGKEDVDGDVHYLVKWNPTLVPKYALKNAKEMVNKFEARLRAQARQEHGRGRLPQSKRTILEAQAVKGMQQKKRRGRH